MRQKKSSPKTKPIILGDEINYRVKGLSVLLEVETESHFQSEFRTVFIYIPINGRFNGYRTRQEERVTAFQAEAETGFVTAVPVITVQVDVSSEENAYFVDIITSAHTQSIDIRPACHLAPASINRATSSIKNAPPLASRPKCALSVSVL